jgi:Putative nucleotidyltransferase DUF294
MATWPATTHELIGLQHALREMTPQPLAASATLSRIGACFVCFEPVHGAGAAGDRGWPTAFSDRSDQFRAGAEVVLIALEHCGLSRCPDGANATEPRFARSVDGRSEATARWTRYPESGSALLLASIVVDNRPLTNVYLGRALTQSMLNSARDRNILDALSHFTLAVKPQRRLMRGFASGGADDSHVAPRALDPLRRRYLNDGLRAIAEIQTAVRNA